MNTYIFGSRSVAVVQVERLIDAETLEDAWKKLENGDIDEETTEVVDGPDEDDIRCGEQWVEILNEDSTGNTLHVDWFEKDFPNLEG